MSSFNSYREKKDQKKATAGGSKKKDGTGEPIKFRGVPKKN